MSQSGYLLDTHALLFWVNKENISTEFISFLDQQNQQQQLFISTIIFWEIALLVQKRKILLADLPAWQEQLLANTNLQLLSPTPIEMINSTVLPPIHKDPFDRLLIAQANQHKLQLVTQDETIKQYSVSSFWLP
jgi:PIN domain nuclease of toxin-antitoxin system